MVHDVRWMDGTTTRGPLTVAQVAALTGVSVRTLHHYDAIGLVVPAARSDAGYRLYGATQLERLRAVLVWRRLGIPLREVERLLDERGGAADRAAVLRRQLDLVRERRRELDGLATALEQALETIGDDEEANVATDEEIIGALDGFDPSEHEQEVQERWGDTEAYRQSARRTKAYGAEDWRRIKAEGAAVHERLEAAFDAGLDPTGDEAVELAEAWRAHVTRWFYDMPPAMLAGLGDVYVADPRFRASYDGADGERAGMAEWVRDAWHARAARDHDGADD
jgi:DNA-binding transcriptional MerR regulator